jgi:hypothetical protein
VSDGDWKPLEDDASDPSLAVLRRGRVRLERADEEFVLVLEPNPGSDGHITSVRVALRRGGGGGFAGPGGTYPAVGSIYESLMVHVVTPAANIQALGSTERGQIRQAAQTVLERAGRRLDARRS